MLEAYCRFLFNVGEQSLPSGFLVVAGCLERGEVSAMLSRSNTVFCLESLLRSYVYGQPLRMKSDSGLRRSVLLILDSLVEAGSSAAFRIRDDFVTPIGTR